MVKLTMSIHRDDYLTITRIELFKLFFGKTFKIHTLTISAKDRKEK